MYLVFTFMSGESYRTQVFVAVLVLRISSANYLPLCVDSYFSHPALCPLDLMNSNRFYIKR